MTDADWPFVDRTPQQHRADVVYSALGTLSQIGRLQLKLNLQLVVLTGSVQFDQQASDEQRRRVNEIFLTADDACFDTRRIREWLRDLASTLPIRGLDYEDEQ